MKKIIGSVAFTCLITLLLAFYFVNFNENSIVLKYWEQPKAVESGKYKYRLSIFEVKPKLNLFKIGKNENQYKIVISKNQEKPEILSMFGHSKSYSFAESNKYSPQWKELDILSYVEKCKVAWNNKGVIFIEPSGQELFFPNNVYINE